MKDIGILDILLIIVIIYIIYLWYKNNRSNEKFFLIDKVQHKKRKSNFNDMFDTKSNDDLNINIFDYNNKKRKHKNVILKPHFMEMQFHTDYRDTITAF